MWLWCLDICGSTLKNNVLHFEVRSHTIILLFVKYVYFWVIVWDGIPLTFIVIDKWPTLKMRCLNKIFWKISTHFDSLLVTLSSHHILSNCRIFFAWYFLWCYLNLVVLILIGLGSPFSRIGTRSRYRST